MKLQELYHLYKQSYAVSTDTRKIAKGCLFFALKGDNFNGNKFAKEALLKGASYAIVDEEEYQNGSNTILVDDVLKTLQALATFHREELRIPILGLTGSNGKTTTKELINAVLSKDFVTSATLGNLNNHIGVPLTLLAMKPDTEIGIVEMGANHLNEIDFLCHMAQPDYGYITNFGKAHLEGFGSLDGVVQGKTELYKYLNKKNKTLFVNAEDGQQMKSSKGINRITFGDLSADITIKLINANPYVNVEFNEIVVHTNLIGAYNFTNIAAAIAIGNYFKVSPEHIKKSIENLIPADNRSQIIKKGTNKIILDAYNANPTSMQAALENLSGLTDANKIAILGDMYELGTEAEIEHQYITDLATSINVDKIVLVGNNFHRTTSNSPKVFLMETYDGLKEYLLKQPPDHTTILIKASRGMALERILDLL